MAGGAAIIPLWLVVIIATILITIIMIAIIMITIIMITIINSSQQAALWASTLAT